MFDAFKVGEKWTTVIPSKIDVDFFDSVATLQKSSFASQGATQLTVLLTDHNVSTGMSSHFKG